MASGDDIEAGRITAGESTDGEGNMAERFGDDEFRSVFALPKVLRHTSNISAMNDCYDVSEALPFNRFAEDLLRSELLNEDHGATATAQRQLDV
jgi:hypothetical protein